MILEGAPSVARQSDILEVIANLSNQAVFTPPRVVNAVLDLLPPWVWSDPSLRWLDPGAKTGVFPREITKRLLVGLSAAIPDEAERLRHILEEMVFAVATEQVTALMSRRSLYCSKDGTSRYSAVRLGRASGNVWHRPLAHEYDDSGKCVECKGIRDQLEKPNRDNRAYGFIHKAGQRQIEEDFGMRFDVIVGNPPYQMDADGGTRTMPIYNLFMQQALELNPRFISFIIPSRWMAGGLGLSEFRAAMLGDRRIRDLFVYSKMETLFPGVDFEGGVCYFLWDRDNEGDCRVTYVQDDVRVGPSERVLDEFDIFVRDERALPILKKVLAKGEASLSAILAADKEFGMTSNFSGFSKTPKAGHIAIYYNDRGKRMNGWMARKAVPKSDHLIDTWKVLIPQAYGERGAIPAQVLGPLQVVAPPSVCTQTFLFVHVGSEPEAQSVQSYLQTRFARFLISLRKTTQHATRSTYLWVPQQPWDSAWSDADLFAKYGLSAGEREYIESMIRPAGP